MIDQRLLERPRPGQRLTGAQSHRLAVLDPVEAEREGRRGEAVQRGDGRGQPLGRRIVEVVERDERDMEEVGAASGVVARQRYDRILHLRRRLCHDVEGVSGAHRRVCSMVWGWCRVVGSRERMAPFLIFSPPVRRHCVHTTDLERRKNIGLYAASRYYF